MTVIDLPFSVSPVVAGLIFVLIFGLNAPLGAWLKSHGYQVMFAAPALVLVTAFVTAPFVARELIPVLEAAGSERRNRGPQSRRERLANVPPGDAARTSSGDCSTA